MDDVDNMYEADTARLWEYLNDDGGQCCKYCVHYNCPFCMYYDGVYPEKDDDDWCENFRQEYTYPGEDW